MSRASMHASAYECIMRTRMHARYNTWVHRHKHICASGDAASSSFLCHERIYIAAVVVRFARHPWQEVHYLPIMKLARCQMISCPWDDKTHEQIQPMMKSARCQITICPWDDKTPRACSANDETGEVSDYLPMGRQDPHCLPMGRPDGIRQHYFV